MVRAARCACCLPACLLLGPAARLSAAAGLLSSADARRAHLPRRCNTNEANTPFADRLCCDNTCDASGSAGHRAAPGVLPVAALVFSALAAVLAAVARD